MSYPLSRIAPAFTDARGAITDLLTKTVIDAVTLIESNAGTVRGNHYHKDTEQWLYLLSGMLEIAWQEHATEVKSGSYMYPGEMMHSPPGEAHAVKALKDSVFVVMTRGPRNGADYESDTFRLNTPLLTEPNDPRPRTAAD
jgi:dTDP-4-dehydrorhamnose 3,5-epimerase-like enzyme